MIIITNENRKTRNRIIAIVTCLLVMLLCAACAPSDEPTANEEIAPQTDQGSTAVYDEVLNSYRELFDMGKDGCLKHIEDNGLLESNDGINYWLPWDCFNDGANAVWGTVDYNGDGVDELVLASDSDSYKKVYAIYSTDGTKAYELRAGEPLRYRIDAFVLPEGTFVIHGSGGATAGIDTICTIAEDCTGFDVVATYEYDEAANGTMDHFSDDETLGDEEFQEKYFSKAVDAAEFGGIEFSPLMAS